MARGNKQLVMSVGWLTVMVVMGYVAWRVVAGGDEGVETVTNLVDEVRQQGKESANSVTGMERGMEFETVYEYVEAAPLQDHVGVAFDSTPRLGGVAVNVYGTLDNMDLAKGEGTLQLYLPDYIRVDAERAFLTQLSEESKGVVAFAIGPETKVRSPYTGQLEPLNELVDARILEALTDSYVMVVAVQGEQGGLIAQEIAITVI